ncbi:MAG: DOMON domain-containing protein [Pseudomonadota bacterium]
MDRRTALVAAATLIATPSTSGASEVRRLEAGGMTFSWRHLGGRLYGRLRAPGRGWLAVGFNDQPNLRGTRFVMAAVREGVVRVEERLALVPEHVPISEAGGRSGLADVAGAFDGHQSEVVFSMPHTTEDTLVVHLAPGSRSHVMLAYATHPEFDHHSRWRGHFDVTL